MDHYQVFNFNLLKENNIQQTLRFIKSEISSRKVEKLIPKRMNAQRIHQMKSFDSWDEEEKKMVMKITGDLAKELGYTI